MTTLVVATSEGVNLRLEIAGAGSRFAAGILDGLILVFTYLVVLIAAMIPVGFDTSGVSAFVFGLLAGGALLYVLLYHVLFHALREGQTPGKSALGIRVMSADGSPPSSFQIVMRALVWPIDVILLVPIPIGLVFVAATARHQRLGDLVAGTLVVRKPSAAADLEPWPGQRWSDLQFKTLRLAPGATARIDARDLEFLRALITRTDLADEERRRLFVDAARHYAERLGLGPFDDARDVLRELYLYARESARARESGS
jgi:uncharacterized RDD family membrane protein YckC